MNLRKILTALAALAAVAAVAAGVLTYDTWRGWLFPDKPAPQAKADDHGHAHRAHESVTLTPQARANLKLIVKPLQLETYTRTVMIPGMVVERQGRSDRGVTAPIAGVVKRVAAVPGDGVRPGDALFTLRLNSESVQNSQTELYKTTRELEINEDQRKRLEPLSKSGSVAEARILEFDYQQRRLSAAVQALRYDLAARGLTPEQIQEAAGGKFVTEIVIRAPAKEAAGAPAAGAPPDGPVHYEVEDLKVQLGDQVQAGQLLLTLADHQALFVEGRVFKQEAPLLEVAAQKGWPVRAEFAEEAASHWPPFNDPLKIRFLGNRVDPASQTVPVYAPLANQYREYAGDGKTYRIWRFRPGQRARLYVPVEQFPDVFVLPAEAVVREGPEAYVFRANGDAFDRKPVQVLYEDRETVALANDGSVNVNNYVARNGAAALNRALKAQAAGGEGGHGHDHSGHSH